MPNTLTQFHLAISVSQHSPPFTLQHREMGLWFLFQGQVVGIRDWGGP
jgi:hypothetical protein